VKASAVEQIEVPDHEEEGAHAEGGDRGECRLRAVEPLHPGKHQRETRKSEPH